MEDRFPLNFLSQTDHLTSMRILIFILLSTLLTVAEAASGWTSYGKVIELQPDSDFRFRVLLDVKENPSRCRKPQWFFATYQASGADQIYDSLRDALVYDLHVKAFVSGVCDLKGFSEISAINVTR